MNPFLPLESNKLPESAGSVLEKTRVAFGFVPNLATVMAHSPLSLNGYLDSLQVFSKSSFSPSEQQLVLLTASVANGVPYAVAIHTVLARAAGLPKPFIEAIRNLKPVDDGRLQSLRTFTERAVKTKGQVDEPTLTTYLSAGWSKSQMIEIFFALSIKEFVYLLQRMADVPLDEPLFVAKWTSL